MKSKTHRISKSTQVNLAKHSESVKRAKKAKVTQSVKTAKSTKRTAKSKPNAGLKVVNAIQQHSAFAVSNSSKAKAKTNAKVKATPLAAARPKSKAPPILVDSLAVGHRPFASLSPQDEVLFRSFQSNLLSLISHELRTPLTGILNALTALEEGVSSPFAPSELISMARRNTQKLHQNLITLLDLAAIESGTFHVQLREVEFYTWIRNQMTSRSIDAKSTASEATDPASVDSSFGVSSSTKILLIDPNRLSQVLDLTLQVMLPRIEPQSRVKWEVKGGVLDLQFILTPVAFENWNSVWLQSRAGFEGGLASPSSAFAGVLQSEQAFLNRIEEGLGSELILIHEIMRLHRGSCTAIFQSLQSYSSREVILRFSFPDLDSEEALKTVLNNRIFQISTQLGTVALILIEVPQSLDVHELRKQVQKCLYRSTDVSYAIAQSHRVALVLNDCRNEDIPHLITRIAKALSQPSFSYGAAHCPTDGSEASFLLELAEKRLSSNSK